MKKLILAGIAILLCFPVAAPEDIAAKNTSLKLGKRARLFFKYSDLGRYFSEYIVEFEK
ncbi:MAG: hypothetical protein O2829_11120 [Bacteroidetes bacterium]|nr:hypothetical protein [Bacteroidota bacterium]